MRQIHLRLVAGVFLATALLAFTGCNTQPTAESRLAIRASPDSGCDTAFCPIGAVDHLGLFVYVQDAQQVNAAPAAKVGEADPG